MASSSRLEDKHDRGIGESGFVEEPSRLDAEIGQIA